MSRLRTAEAVAGELIRFLKAAGHASEVRALWTELGPIDVACFVAEARLIVIDEWGVESVSTFDR